MATAVAMAAAESVVRTIDGYALSSLSLQRRAGPRQAVPSPGGKLTEAADAAVFTDALPVAATVNRDWWALDPDRTAAARSDPELDRRYRSHPGHELESVYEWNRAYVQEAV